jgi:hypothetical protein
MFTGVTTMGTGIDARIRGNFPFVPEKGLGLNLLSTFFAKREIQRLQMSRESFLSFFGGRKIRQRRFEV